MKAIESTWACATHFSFLLLQTSLILLREKKGKPIYHDSIYKIRKFFLICNTFETCFITIYNIPFPTFSYSWKTSVTSISSKKEKTFFDLMGNSNIHVFSLTARQSQKNIHIINYFDLPGNVIIIISLIRCTVFVILGVS